MRLGAPPSLPEELRHSSERIKCVNLDEVTPFHGSAWKHKFPQHEEVGDLCDRYATGLARSDLAELAAKAVDSQAAIDRRKLLFATFMWGYGPRGGRSYLWANLAIRSPNLDETLRNAVEMAIEHGPAEAYSAFNNRVDGYNQGYFTKYLYFVGLGARGSEPAPERPKPMIWDSLVQRALDYYRDFLGLEWKGRDSGAASYAYYCSALANWAGELNCDRTDRVELYLFKVGQVGPADRVRRAVLRALGEGVIEMSQSSSSSAIRGLPEKIRSAITLAAQPEQD
jgi:hypothetical protein